MDKDSFTIKNTNIIKGIAVCLLIFHHLFYTKTNAMPIINGVSITNQIGLLCKVCVGIFIFLSGYGIRASYERQKNLLCFYKKRFLKIYLNYWLIWLLFVPITIYIFHGQFRYGNHFYIKMFLDLLGTNAFFGFKSINGNFWFIGVIVLLYLLFPLLNLYIEKFDFWGLIPAYFFMVSKSFSIGPFSIDVLRPWVFCFSLGILFNKKDLFRTVEESFSDVPKVIRIVVSFFSIILFSFLRKYNYRLGSVNFDGFYAMIFCISIFLITPTNLESNNIFRFFELLGKHSMNIYLFHTFILIYWFNKIFYTGNVFMFIPAVFICLFFSIILERLKKIIKLDKII